MVQAQTPSVVTQTPFGNVKTVRFEVGATVKDIADDLFGSSDLKWQALIRMPDGDVAQWQVIPEWLLPNIKPKTEDCIKFEYIPAGGDSGGGFLAVVLAIAVTAIAGPLAGAILGAGASAFATAALTAAITIGGNIAIQSVFQSQIQSPNQGQAQTAESQQAQFENVSSDSNPIGVNQLIPRVIGRRRITLQEAAFPHQFIKNGRDTVERVFILSGRHEIEDIRLDNVSASDLAGVEIDISDGQESSASQQIVKNVAKTKSINHNMTTFSTEDDSEVLTNQANPANSEPSPIVFSPGFDESLEQYTFRTTLRPMYTQDSLTRSVRTPYRIRFRKKDSEDWYNLPEIHISGRNTNQRPLEFIFRFDVNFAPVDTTNELSFDFYQNVPAAEEEISSGETGLQWESHPAFSTGSGSLGAANIFATNDSVNVFIDPQVFGVSDLEFEFKQGITIEDNDFTRSSYETNNTVESLFFAKRNDEGLFEAPISRDGIFGGMNIDWMVYKVNRRPVEMPGIAQIGMRVSDVDARNVTCIASGYAYIWNGTDWNTFGITNNPADWYYTTLKEWLEYFDCSTDIINIDELSSWRDECEAQGYEVGFVQTGQTITETLQLISAAGFASPRFGYDFGIDYFRDRSSEVPIMSFSHRDSKIGVSYTSFETPKGARVVFSNEEKAHEEDSFYINDPYGATSFLGNDVFEYTSITNPDLIKRRANFDLLKISEMQRVWTVDTGVSGFFRKRGDLVNIVTDLFSDYSHGFFIREVMDERTVAIDSAIPAEDSGDFLGVQDLLSQDAILEIGSTALVSILTKDGSQTYTVASVAENIIRFTTDLENTDIVGARMQVVSRDTLFNRCIVLDVTRQADQRSTLTLIDESPQIYETLQRLQ